MTQQTIEEMIVFGLNRFGFWFVELQRWQQIGVMGGFGLLALLMANAYLALAAPVDGLEIQLGVGRWRGYGTLVTAAVLAMVVGVLLAA